MPLVKPPRDLKTIRCVRKYKDKNGDTRYNLRVLFNYVLHWQGPSHLYSHFLKADPEWNLTREDVLNTKELFQIYDTDQTGVITYHQVKSAMKVLGHRFPGRPEDCCGGLRFCSTQTRHCYRKFVSFLQTRKTIPWNSTSFSRWMLTSKIELHSLTPVWWRRLSKSKPNENSLSLLFIIKKSVRPWRRWPGEPLPAGVHHVQDGRFSPRQGGVEGGGEGEYILLEVSRPR